MVIIMVLVLLGSLSLSVLSITKVLGEQWSAQGENKQRGRLIQQLDNLSISSIQMLQSGDLWSQLSQLDSNKEYLSNEPFYDFKQLMVCSLSLSQPWQVLLQQQTSFQFISFFSLLTSKQFNPDNQQDEYVLLIKTCVSEPTLNYWLSKLHILKVVQHEPLILQYNEMSLDGK